MQYNTIFKILTWWIQETQREETGNSSDLSDPVPQGFSELWLCKNVDKCKKKVLCLDFVLKLKWWGIGLETSTKSMNGNICKQLDAMSNGGCVLPAHFWYEDWAVSIILLAWLYGCIVQENFSFLKKEKESDWWVSSAERCCWILHTKSLLLNNEITFLWIFLTSWETFAPADLI